MGEEVKSLHLHAGPPPLHGAPGQLAGALQQDETLPTGEPVSAPSTGQAPGTILNPAEAYKRRVQEG